MKILIFAESLHIAWNVSDMVSKKNIAETGIEQILLNSIPLRVCQQNEEHMEQELKSESFANALREHGFIDAISISLVVQIMRSIAEKMAPCMTLVLLLIICMRNGRELFHGWCLGSNVRYTKRIWLIKRV